MDSYEFAVAKVREAGELLLRLRDQGFEISAKGGNPKDIVTSVDTAVNAFLIDAIKEAFPGHRVYSEEGGGLENDGSYQWVIDPIDGSSNFSRGIPHFAVCLGLLENGTPVVGVVYNPVTRELFSFKKGGGAFLNDKPIRVRDNTDLAKASVFLHAGRRVELRDWGGESYRRLLGAAWKTSNYSSSGLDACFVAAGRIDANIYGTLCTLDIAGALGILLEAGGVFSNEKGEPLPFSTDVERIYMANNPTMLEAVRTLLA